MNRLLKLFALISIPLFAQEPVDIGGRRELFVDDLLIGKMEGTKLKLHEPTLLKPKSPPRPSGHYATVFKDGDRYRLYYRGDKIPGMHWRNGWGKYHENEVTLYAESKNGYDWVEPDLGIYDIESMPKGNVVLDVDEGTFLKTHNFSPFIDNRPGVPKEERYKALGGGRYPAENWGSWKSEDERAKLIEKYGPGGLCAFSSPDGLRWKLMQKSPVIPEAIGNFDSQNVSFWSEAEQCYVCYYRWFRNGYRSMRRVTSKDFITWSDPTEMQANQPGEHLYTSGTQPYFRAPHLYIALATRFQTKRAAITDVVFMSTRPGSDHYDRPFKEAFIRPGLGAQGWGNRSNYIAWGVVPTGPSEMSMYMYGGGHYVLRTDGFISVHAGYEPGEFITKPLIFSGKHLDLNYSTSAAGRMRVEILDAKTGNPFPGFSEADSRDIYGDDISRIVKWGEEKEGNTDVSSLVGKVIQLRFVMNESDLYSIQFVDGE
ncbi:hypothetical protein OAE61_00515 [Verrucomicrobiales bacterium]|nr:hypothetical protein [Verrucomicrobiales bacterium]MDB4662095.1 hypothetical protein [Verrucomicrobiales bacterium]